MAAITNLIDQLKRDESVRLFPYIDSVGKTTIGVGRNLTDVGISMAESDLFLQNDITRATSSLEEALPWTSTLDPIRLAAVTNMSFNMGIKGLMGFRNFLAAMQTGDWNTASAEMLNSKWATQVGARAQRLSQQILSGEWQ
jgi:lysozyme